MENEKTRIRHQRADTENEKTRIRHQHIDIENEETQILLQHKHDAQTVNSPGLPQPVRQA